MAITTITTTTQTTSVELDTEAQSLVNELRTLRDQTTALEKRKSAIRDSLMALLGDAEVGLVDGVVRLRQREESRRSINYDLLLKEYSEIYSLVVSSSTHKKLDIK